MRRTLAALVLALAFAATVTYTADRVHTLGVSYETGAYYDDYRDGSYLPALDLRQGHDPYDAPAFVRRQGAQQEYDLYLPAHLLFQLPLSYLPYRRAEPVVFCLTVLFLTLCGAALLRLARAPATLPWVLGAASVLQLAQAGRIFGQINPVVCLGVWWAATHARHRPGLAAWGLALALLKPQYGVPTAVLLLALGHGRVVWKGVAVAFVASLPVLVALVVADGGVGGFVAALRRNGEYATTTSTGTLASPDQQRIDLAGTLARAVHGLPDSPTAVLQLLVVLAAGGLLLRRLRVARVEEGDGRRLAFSTLFCATVLACVVHQPTDLLLLAWPLALGVAALVRDSERGLAALTVLALAPGFFHQSQLNVLLLRTSVALQRQWDGLCVVLCVLVGVAGAVTLSRRAPDAVPEREPARPAA